MPEAGPRERMVVSTKIPIDSLPHKPFIPVFSNKAPDAVGIGGRDFPLKFHPTTSSLRWLSCLAVPIWGLRPTLYPRFIRLLVA